MARSFTNLTFLRNSHLPKSRTAAMPINLQQPTKRIVPADNILHGHRIENLP